MRWRKLLPAIGLLGGSLTAFSDSPAYATIGISQHKGIDTCAAPSVSKMQAFWNGTPYWNIGIYIGGSARACSQPNLTSSWLTQVGPGGIGWQFLPIWVGPQAPCTGYSSRFSYNTTTAYAQGRTEGSMAYSAILNLGMGSDVPVIYDLEAFNTGSASCLAAARSFIRGWTEYLALPPAQRSGVYGSGCGSGLNSFATIARPPDFIWGAHWNLDPNTRSIACVNSGYWVNNQRHKQYRGGHNETWNGVTLNIDNNCSNGPVYPAPNRFSSTDGCL